MDKEIWRVVVLIDIGEVYEDYMVSNFGRIKSLKCGREHIMKPQYHRDGYLEIQLPKDGKAKHFKVHRLVAMAFCGETYFFGAEVDHINTIKDDNRADNLRFVTSEENLNNPLTVEKLNGNSLAFISTKRVLCVETGKIYNTIREAYKDIGIRVNSSQISACCKGNIKTAYGYHWKYVD